MKSTIEIAEKLRKLVEKILIHLMKKQSQLVLELLKFMKVIQKIVYTEELINYFMFQKGREKIKFLLI